MDIFKVTFSSQHIAQQEFFCRYLHKDVLLNYLKDHNDIGISQDDLYEFVDAFVDCKDLGGGKHTHRTDNNDLIFFVIEKIKIY